MNIERTRQEEVPNALSVGRGHPCKPLRKTCPTSRPHPVRRPDCWAVGVNPSTGTARRWWSPALSSLVGLVYWVVAAQLFPPAEVGVVSALVSTLMLLGSVGHLNLGVALLRFVPVAGGRVRQLVAGCYLVGAAAAGAVGAGFALGAGWWAPDLLESVGQGGLVAFLAVAAPVWAVFVMQDYVLTALGRAVRVPIANLAFAVAKLVLLALAAVFAIHTGIALSWLVATILMVAVVSVLVFRLLPARSSGTRVTAGEVARFVRADYAGELCSTAVVFGLPVVVLPRLGQRPPPPSASPDHRLHPVPGAARYGPGDGRAPRRRVRRVAVARRGMVLRAYALLVPAVLVLAVAARPLLAVFGLHYAATGVTC